MEEIGIHRGDVAVRAGALHAGEGGDAAHAVCRAAGETACARCRASSEHASG
jgi:hypothetical protein